MLCLDDNSKKLSNENKTSPWRIQWKNVADHWLNNHWMTPAVVGAMYRGCDWSADRELWLVSWPWAVIGQLTKGCDWSADRRLWLVSWPWAVIGQLTMGCDWSADRGLWLVIWPWPVIGQLNMGCDWSADRGLWLVSWPWAVIGQLTVAKILKVETTALLRITKGKCTEIIKWMKKEEEGLCQKNN